jgi:hypothetical protein
LLLRQSLSEFLLPILKNKIVQLEPILIQSPNYVLPVNSLALPVQVHPINVPGVILPIPWLMTVSALVAFQS